MLIFQILLVLKRIIVKNVVILKRNQIPRYLQSHCVGRFLVCMYFSTILKVLKMIYQLFWFLTTCFTFLFNALWLCCNFASVGIPWLMLLFFLVCIASKFVKLKCPASEIVQSMLHRSEKGVDSEVLYWPIVSRGGAFDAPENSLAAINHV